MSLIFKFKQFEVSHCQSSMRIGVDGVLLGAWCSGHAGMRAVDVGTGCGVIALMLAQRFSNAKIEAIDIDDDSVIEACRNFNLSPWPRQLHGELKAFDGFIRDCRANGFKYDLVVSNPPFFDSGVKNLCTPREKARHQSDLSPSVLLKHAPDVLSPAGRLSLIVPEDVATQLISQSEQMHNIILARRCSVRGLPNKRIKRLMLEFALPNQNTIQNVRCESLILEASPGQPTDDYRALCKDFYLRF